MDHTLGQQRGYEITTQQVTTTWTSNIKKTNCIQTWEN